MTALTLVRNATVLLELGESVVLVDPMLNAAGAAPPVADTAPAVANPLVDLPLQADHVVERSTAVLVTHLHNDHFDAEARRRLAAAGLPLLCQPADHDRLAGDGLAGLRPVEDHVDLGGGMQVHRVPARHTLGEHEAALGPGSGYVLTSDGPTVYVTGDCVWCEELAATLDRFGPDVVVVNAGAARFLTGAHISMTSEDVIATARHAPAARIVAVHLEALNHCPMTREELRRHTVAAGIDERVVIPADGERIALSRRR